MYTVLANPTHVYCALLTVCRVRYGGRGEKMRGQGVSVPWPILPICALHSVYVQLVPNSRTVLCECALRDQIML